MVPIWSAFHFFNFQFIKLAILMLPVYLSFFFSIFCSCYFWWRFFIFSSPHFKICLTLRIFFCCFPSFFFFFTDHLVLLLPFVFATFIFAFFILIQFIKILLQRKSNLYIAILLYMRNIPHNKVKHFHIYLYWDIFSLLRICVFELPHMFW